MRKRLYLLNRDFQFRYMGLVVAVGSFSTILTTIIILYPLFAFRILRIPEFLPMPIFLAMLLAAVVNIALISFMTVMLTHRIVGPLYNLVRNMRRFESSHWNGHIAVREQDELKYVMRNFNGMVDEIINTLKTDIAKLRQLEEHQPVAPQVKQLANELEERTQNFHTLHKENK